MLTKLAAAQIEPLTVAVLRTVLGGVAAAPLALALRLPLPPRSLALPFTISSFCGRTRFRLEALFVAETACLAPLYGLIVEHHTLCLFCMGVGPGGLMSKKLKAGWLILLIWCAISCGAVAAERATG